MKNQKIYIHFLFWRIFPILGLVLFATLFAIFFDVEAVPFCVTAICICVAFSFFMWTPGIFIDRKKNLVVIRTFDVLGTLKIPLDTVENINVIDRKTGANYSIEFCVRKKMDILK